MVNKFNISLAWDDEACVWIATSNDIPGLILEDDSYDRLIARVRIAVPDLLSLAGDVYLVYTTEQYERLTMSG